MSNQTQQLLVVEDEAPQRRIICRILRQEGFTVVDVESAEEAISRIEERVPDLVLCDWRLPGMSGGDLLVHTQKHHCRCAFIVMTAYGSISHAVSALRSGADDYLAKPFEKEALLLAVRRVLRTRDLEAENRRLREEIAGKDRYGEIVGSAPSMQTLYRTIAKIAAASATVLIIGESGTGKELVARSLHAHSTRLHQPFVAINCAAMPENLMESELFGHEKGAFTGAEAPRDGKFAEAEGGSLFLDEVSAMPLPLQAKLLRVLQERSYTPLGGKGEKAADVRIIAATNRDLRTMVAEARFREDLFFRLNVLPIRIPPLRDRKQDIPLLVREFMTQAMDRYGIRVDGMPAGMLRRLISYGWPGNVRELANVIERLVLLAEDGALQAEDLPGEILTPKPVGDSVFRLPAEGIEWEKAEASLLRQALERANGNRTAAARILGLTYKAFLYRIEKYNL